MIFKYNNQGKAGFLKHAKSNQHKHNADGRNRRLPAQLFFVLLLLTARITQLVSQMKKMIVGRKSKMRISKKELLVVS